ncbi:MAG TPA: helix-turn-helix domain-containing protein [Anaerolineae bacterium]|nr:helix-turn-helix domain-containing protein [Anaerolineae bacterium]
MAESLMTLQQASEFLQIDPDTLRALSRRGRVPAMKIGRQWRFDPKLLRDWVREQSLTHVSRSTIGDKRIKRPAPCGPEVIRWSERRFPHGERQEV